MSIDPRYIKRQYENIRTPGSFDAFHGFWKNKSFKDVESVKKGLRKLDSFTLHAPRRKKFQRRAVIVTGIDKIWTSDLIDYQAYSRQNKGNKFILLIIDIFSKTLFTEPLPDKSGASVAAAFRRVFKRTRRRPQKLWVDFGLEYWNSKVQSVLKKENIELYRTFSHTKANIAERAVGVLKTKLARIFTHQNNKKWIDVLPHVTSTINKSYHSSIGMSPDQVTKKNQDTVLMNLYQHLASIPKKKPRYSVGDIVLVSRFKGIFEKGYETNFGRERFRIKAVRPTIPVPTYVLEDLQQPPEQLAGHYYEPELQLVD